VPGRQRRAAEATGVAEATRLQGQAESDVVRLRGMADADAIRAKGEAEAEAMRLKADAFEKYGQAAILDKMITAIPSVVEKIAAPLANVDRIAVISTDGGSSGVNRVTADVARMVAQAPELIEALTGQKIGDMLQRLGAIKSDKPLPLPPNGAGEAETTRSG